MQKVLNLLWNLYFVQVTNQWKHRSIAVLGDQKKGNNLEAPESLLRQIVREESGKGQGDGNTYNVTVNASGRKLLDIIISEAEMRRNRNGKNPFELA